MKNLIKNRLYCLLILFLSLGACTEKNVVVPKPGGNNPPDPQPTGNWLSKIDWGGGAYTEIKYNLNKQIGEIKEVNNANIWTYKLFYDVQNRLDYIRFNDYGRILYDYEGDKLTQVTEINGTTSIYENYLTYNAQNQLIMNTKYQKMADGSLKINFKTTYQYNESGNLIKLQLYMPKADSEDLELSKTILYSDFDDKENVYKNLTFKPLLMYKFFKNNPKKVQNIDELGFTPNYQETYHYQYNAQGKPIQMEVIFNTVGLPEIRGNAFLSYIP
jgi:hypothetical protein